MRQFIGEIYLMDLNISLSDLFNDVSENETDIDRCFSKPVIKE